MADTLLSWLAAFSTYSPAVTAAGVIAAGLWALYTFVFQRRRERAEERRLRDSELQTRKRQDRTQRRDLRWRQVQQAKKINDEMMLDPGAMAMLDLIDDDLDTLEVKKRVFTIQKNRFLSALSGAPLDTSEEATAVRRCLDGWLYYLVLFEHYVQRGLIVAEDIEYPVSYYIKRLRSDVDVYAACVKYIEHYGVDRRALQFVERIGAL